MRSLKASKIFIAGHNGLVGSAIVRALEGEKYERLILKERSAVDLSSQEETLDFFADAKPEYVFLAAAKVGGILGNKMNPCDFILENLKIQNSVMGAALTHRVKKLVFFGSSCVYPRMAPQPLKEEYLGTGPLEETNDAYAIAKIAGIKLCQSIYSQHRVPFIALMPCSLYGPNDNYDLKRCHVLPALIRRFHEAKKKKSKRVTLWGDGTAMRELLHADDLARAAILCMKKYKENKILNIGSGNDIDVKSLAHIVRDTVGYLGNIEWDTSMPSGTPKKLLDSSRILEMGWWAPRISLLDGIHSTYLDYIMYHS